MKINTEKTISFRVALPNNKYLGINLTRYEKDIYTENYQTSLGQVSEPM